MNKSKIFMIISICILVLSVAGATGAYYVQELVNIDADTITYGLDYYINYEKGQNITGTLETTPDYTTSANATIELWKDADTPYDIYGHIYLDITTLSQTMSDLNALNYYLVNNGNVISNGVIKKNSKNTILLKDNIPLSTTEELYTVYIWLDESKINSTLSQDIVSLTLRCEATMKKLEKPPIATTMIRHLYNMAIGANPTKRSIDSLGGSYYYARGTRLLNDGLSSTAVATEYGNLLYFCDYTNTNSCAAVNNYIYFNCGDYSDTTTCETWRILGVIDGKVKIIRPQVIGNYSYDYNSDGTYNYSWDKSTLMKLLNEDYYYNRDNVQYYNGSATPITINFKEDGVGITDETRNNDLIADTTWYNANAMTITISYNYVHSTVYSAERTGGYTWDGKIGIMTPSEILSSYWIDKTFYGSSSGIWLLNKVGNQNTSNTAYNMSVSYYSMNPQQIKSPAGIIPTLYLNENVRIKDGDGSSDDPYQIDV